MSSVVGLIGLERPGLFALELGKIAASIDINQSAPYLIKMYIAIRSLMSLIVAQIGPELDVRVILSLSLSLSLSPKASKLLSWHCLRRASVRPFVHKCIRKLFLQKTSPQKLLAGFLPNFTGMFLRWLSIKFLQIIVFHEEFWLLSEFL